MKNFITCLTLFLLANLAHGQIVSGTFSSTSDLTVLDADIAMASITTGAGTSAPDCGGVANSARILSSTNSPQQIITIVVTPVASGQLRISEVTLNLAVSGNGVNTGTATVTVGGVSFGSQAVSNSCVSGTLLSFSSLLGDVVSLAPVTITIAVNGYNNSRSLTYDNINILGLAQILPVELTKFNVKKTQQSVMLAWATASEKNNDHFEIQKSTNGTQFETIGQVKGNGTTVTGATYSFEDKTPSVGIAYYRLKQVDADGKYEFSSVRSILFGKNKIAVFSTVAKEKISIIVSDDQSVPFDIINLNGQSVLTGKAIGQYTIDISNLHSGMYFIRTQGGEVTRFVKD